MSWKIKSFESSRGEKFVESFLYSLEIKARSKTAQLIDLLEEHGSYLKMPYAKRLTKEIYELRVRGREEVRVLYCFKQDVIYLLHGFKKKTQKTPQREIDLALKRFLDLT